MSIKELNIGDKAPIFKVMGSDGKEHSLEDYVGRKVILYFYPKDNTPGCSLEAQDFKNHYEKFIDNNTVVLGISRDNLKSHERFIQKYDLPFVLLSDENEEVCKLYDVLKEKNMFGRKVFGIERSTFVINSEGIIEDIYRKVKVKGHVENLL